MAYAKINNVTNANMAKVSGVAKAAIGKIINIDAPGAASVWTTNHKSIAFDRTNDYFAATGGAMTPYDEFSYGIWMKTEETAAQVAWQYSQQNYCYFISSPSGQIPYIITPMGNITNATIDVGDGDWHFIAVTCEGESGSECVVKLYIDGSLHKTLTSTPTYTITSGEELKIGRFIVDGGGFIFGYFGGSLDEFSIWRDKVLSAAEITTLYNSGAPIALDVNSGDYASSGDLTHWYRMGDNDTYPTIEDNKGDYDFTMTNMTEADIEEDVPS